MWESQTPPRRLVLADEIYDRVLAALLDHRIRPGGPINIDEISRQWGVSPTPIREALARLEGFGLVKREPHRGYVASPPPTRQALEELMDFRELLEVKGAWLACKQMDDGLLDDLTNTIAEMRTAKTGPDYEEYREFQRADAAFHELIVNSARSRYLRDAVLRLGWHYQRSRLYGGTGISDAAQAIREHEHVLAAFQGGSPEKTATAMRRHLRGVRARVLASLDEHG